VAAATPGTRPAARRSVRKFLATAVDLAKQTFKEYSADKAPRLGAALSYYTVFPWRRCWSW